MKNILRSKRGWVAIIEMSMAIVILFSFFILAFDNPLDNKAKDYSNIGQEILYQIENNETIRTWILGGSDLEILMVEQFLREDIMNFDSSVNISLSSSKVPESKDIRAYDYFVTKGEDFKKLKVFLWSE